MALQNKRFMPKGGLRFMRSCAKMRLRSSRATATLIDKMSNLLPCPTVLALAGGRIRCRQCAAASKRTGNQCRAPAMQGKRVCRFHGGKSTGPRTLAGLERCAAAKTTHGEDTTAMRAAHLAAAKRIKQLEGLARRLGLFAPRRRSGDW